MMVVLSRSPQRCFTRGGRRATTVTVDNNKSFRPDIWANAATWNVWAWLLGFAGARTPTGSVYLPAHFHFSPPCTTFGWAKKFHGRIAGALGGYEGDLVCEAANRCVYAMCYLLAQLASLATVVTYTVENPASSVLWDLPCVAALMSRSVVLDVSYCLFGAGVPKDTRFVCHPQMDFGAWATLCEGPGVKYYRFVCADGPPDALGGCGGYMPAPTVSRTSGPAPPAVRAHAGRRGGFSIVDAEIPLALCCLLHMAWLAVDAPLRRSSAESRQLSRAEVSRLAGNWRAEFGHDFPPECVPSPLTSDADHSSSDSEGLSDSDGGSAPAPAPAPAPGVEPPVALPVAVALACCDRCGAAESCIRLCDGCVAFACGGGAL